LVRLKMTTIMKTAAISSQAMMIVSSMAVAPHRKSVIAFPE